MLLAVVGFVAYRVTSPEQREHVFAIAIEYLRHLRIVVTNQGPSTRHSVMGFGRERYT